MFYKFLKLIFFSTVLIQASPKTFSSLGDELEIFQEDCKIFQKISPLPTKIKNKCNTFQFQANKSFKVGYKLDPDFDNDIINEKKLNKYLSLLRNLDKKKENILELVYSEATKARKLNNFKYYSQLIAIERIKLYSIDYEFMEKNKDIFEKNSRYISHINYLKYLRNEWIKKEASQTKQQELTVKRKKQKKSLGSSLLNKFDFIIMASSIKDNLLEVVFFYTDRKTNKQVMWTNNSITTNCKAYKNLGTITNPKAIKGELLGSISNKSLTRASQGFYIDLKHKNFGHGIVECRLDIEGTIFNLKSQFYESKNGGFNNFINVKKGL